MEYRPVRNIGSCQFEVRDAGNRQFSRFSFITVCAGNQLSVFLRDTGIRFNVQRLYTESNAVTLCDPEHVSNTFIDRNS